MIAYVKDGDVIMIDVEKRELSVDISKSELTKRKKNWTTPEPRYKRGVMAKYARGVSSASEGAITS
jgi:dihydroxy-acid dehydratase